MSASGTFRGAVYPDQKIAELTAENARLRAIIEAGKKRVGDIKGIHTRWRDGRDARSMEEIMSEIEHIAFSVRCYLDGIPGQYLPQTEPPAVAPAQPSGETP